MPVYWSLIFVGFYNWLINSMTKTDFQSRDLTILKDQNKIENKFVSLFS